MIDVIFILIANELAKSIDFDDLIVEKWVKSYDQSKYPT